MREIKEVIARCLQAWDSGVLDLSDVEHDRDAHIRVTDAAMATWWLLTSASWRGEIHVPAAPGPRSLLQRTGLFDLAQQRGLPVHVKAAGPEAPLPLDIATELTLVGGDRLVLSDLHLPRNRPPEPDDDGRRYPQIQTLLSPTRNRAVASKQGGFVYDASFILYEMIDNVHRWARASDALGVVARTKGGGEGSWDRLHIVIIDDGRGIIESLREDPLALATFEADWADQEPVTVLTHFLEEAFGDRRIPNHKGHGFHVAQTLAGMWVGRVEVLSSDHRVDGRILWAGATPSEGVRARASLTCPGVHGTLISISLNVVSTPQTWAHARADDRQLTLALAGT